ncbi:deoxyribodipyrimidine photo-lyase [Legionella geestiana]|uniref:cryptochrome/photolyase family protein n=1 Tax=Legionella geestiana TaxID=45065 RepID=UPI001092B49B|nr:deoxyribodipyrimidine photo-lyase [Legionella geestiana]QDQ40675.1 deoxyribodipyrimidine photo-lyase [Legionella geestiana]
MSTAIVWFRRDLRVQDNPALNAAARAHECIIPLFIGTERWMGKGAQHWWLHHSLKALADSLAHYGLSLCLRRGDALEVLESLVRAHDIQAVYFNRSFEPEARREDEAIAALLRSLGVRVLDYNATLLHNPDSPQIPSGKVFTPWWKRVRRELAPSAPQYLEGLFSTPDVTSDALDDWCLLPKNPDWAVQFSDHWTPGEKGALQKLEDFLDLGLHRYATARNLPATPATSRLSPHLHFGEISLNLVFHTAMHAFQEGRCTEQNLEVFISELGWREFSASLLYHFPTLDSEPLRAEFARFPWQIQPARLHAWQRGLTGYPIVDAGMRELWHTGYMHNRVRMIVASFLVKDLLIDWREGAAWFLDTLLDADLASNSASWQWVAGCGTDAAPWFRIFNPQLQGETHDPKGIYIKRWIPELRNLPDAYIHTPHEAPFPPPDYPKPIVDHKAARTRALALYQECVKNG